MADEPVTSREKKKKKKKDCGNKAVRKEDISSPGEVHHFYHLGPADSLSPDAGLQMQLPPPCPGQVNEDTVKSTLTLIPPIVTLVPYANSLDLDETPSNSASHADPSCFTLKQHFHQF